MLHADPSVNPELALYSHVYIPYCDGASFTGFKSAPAITSDNTTLVFFRGREIRDAVFDVLFQHHGLGSADVVLLSGCSAGGLAAYLHADYVASRLSPKTRLFVAPDSGLFLDMPTFDGRNVFQSRMQEVFKTHNSTGGLSPRCIANYTETPWQCLFAQNALLFSAKTTNRATMVVNSLQDQWVLQHGFAPDSPEWQACVRGTPATCTDKQIQQITNSVSRRVLESVEEIKNTANINIRFFLHSCWDHCGVTQNDYRWRHVRIGTVSASQALTDWLNGIGLQDQEIDCLLQGPQPCNPTCR